MSTQTVRKPRGSGRQNIPADLIQKWQSSELRIVRPQVRRPKTACERCRTAKVKCNGDGSRQHECERCISRGLSCSYIQSTQSPSPATASKRSDQAPEQSFSEETRIDCSVDPTDHFGGYNTDFQQPLGSSAGWSDMSHPTERSAQQQYMDWRAVDPTLGWTAQMSPATSLELSGALPSAPTTTSNTSAPHNTGPPTSTAEQQSSLSSLGLFPLITSADDLSWQNQLTSQGCQCRTGLALLIPGIRAALQERRLDGIFQVTNDVMKQCQGIVSCRSCKLNCTDLICIMAVFQEADVCFVYIAKGDIDERAININVSMGSYAIEADEEDAKLWRRMLVTQLVRRANGLLDSISARGQDMLKVLDPACRLGRVNIDYLQAVIRNSRENVQHVMEGFQNDTRTAE